jgi:CheY-like chemotaxis protein
VDVVDNGRKAVESARQRAYELILMDCQLPEMDGLEASRRIRALEQAGRSCRPDGQPVPIVALTATATRQNREHCFAAGMTDYLSKPLNAGQLLQLIRQRLNRPTGPIEGSEPVLPDEEESTGPPADLAIARERMGGSEELLRKLARLFLGETEGLLERLRSAVEQQQAQELERTAHRLKGQAATFEARAVVKAATELERMGRQNQLEPAAGMLARLQREMDRLREQLGALGN